MTKISKISACLGETNQKQKMSNQLSYPECKSLSLLTGFMRSNECTFIIPLTINEIILHYIMDVLINKFVKGCYINNITTQYQCLIYLRQLLSIKDPFVKEIISTGVLPRYIILYIRVYRICILMLDIF